MVNQINSIAHITTLISVGIAGADRIWLRTSVKNIRNNIDCIGNIHISIGVGIKSRLGSRPIGM